MEPTKWLSALVISCMALLHMPQRECSCPGSHHPSLYYILRAVNTGFWPPVSHSPVAHRQNTNQLRKLKALHSLCVRTFTCSHVFWPIFSPLLLNRRLFGRACFHHLCIRKQRPKRIQSGKYGRKSLCTCCKYHKCDKCWVIQVLVTIY